MSDYKDIVVAVDLSEEASQIATKAARLAQLHGAQLHIVHVIEPLSFAYGGDIPIDFSTIQEQIQQQAEAQLHTLCGRLNVPIERLHVTLGRPENEVHAIADKLSADLIVVGSHGRHGLALLLGSTANGVLHGAKCDVLAVRVG
ncbi:MAG: universal stress protein UspA [Verrucomicrobiaceae bacterium]|nr:universal stress protein UspA [Verrucomicrobiaceae bacterium]